MSDAIISVENLSKRYLVGHEGSKERYHSLRDTLVRHGRNFARKTLDMARGRQIIQGDEVEEFWALKDVSFEVKPGEVLGIIGRNGAGKSTLLKILSRITEPTKGRVTLRGRVASLLEVGTGFHPELTGRENIFLNGAILGMTRAEIKRKFDEIVDFAGVEKFLDTPVKRYSSGMYVRLAFAVAAHLEPEILVVDEVLAVGDAEFQKKCLGKMEEVAGQGRTVLFVSHNLHSLTQLCNAGLVLQSGGVVFRGTAEESVARYLSGARSANSYFYENPGDGKAPRILATHIIQEERSEQGLAMHLPFEVKIQLETGGEPEVNCTVYIKNAQGIWALHTSDEFSENVERQKKATVRRCMIPAHALNAGAYSLSVAIGTRQGGQLYQKLEDIISFDVEFSGPHSDRLPGSSFRAATSPGIAQWLC